MRHSAGVQHKHKSARVPSPHDQPMKCKQDTALALRRGGARRAAAAACAPPPTHSCASLARRELMPAPRMPPKLCRPLMAPASGFAWLRLSLHGRPGDLWPLWPRSNHWQATRMVQRVGPALADSGRGAKWSRDAREGWVPGQQER